MLAALHLIREDFSGQRVDLCKQELAEGAPKIELRNAPYITGTGRKMFELPIPSTFSVVPSAMARESTVGDVGAFHYAYRR